MDQAWGLYIHSPFCSHKCGYCDFNSWGESSLAPQVKWKNAILRQARFWAQQLPEGLGFDTVFWGGGTPSLLDSSILDSFLRELETIFKILPNAERTIEANPETLDEAKLELFSSHKINRISVGIQSFDDQHLERLERQARQKDNLKALQLLSTKWKGRWSLDLMFGLPGQSLASWGMELDRALEFDPRHLSAYQLTLSTERSKNWKQASSDELLRFFDFTEEKLSTAGFSRYEVSNFCHPGEESRHNLKYWRLSPFLGLGPGASGLLTHLSGMGDQSFHQKSPDHFETWAENCGSDLFERKTLTTRSSKDIFHERLMMGLRLKEGVNLEFFATQEQNRLIERIKKPDLKNYFELDTQKQLRCLAEGTRILDTLLLKLFDGPLNE